MRISPLIGIITFALSIPFPSEFFVQAASAQEEKPAQKAGRIEETQVTAEREQEQGYVVKKADAATKTDAPIFEQPRFH